MVSNLIIWWKQKKWLIRYSETDMRVWLGLNLLDFQGWSELVITVVFLNSAIQKNIIHCKSYDGFNNNIRGLFYSILCVYQYFILLFYFMYVYVFLFCFYCLLWLMSLLYYVVCVVLLYVCGICMCLLCISLMRRMRYERMILLIFFKLILLYYQLYNKNNNYGNNLFNQMIIVISFWVVVCCMYILYVVSIMTYTYFHFIICFYWLIWLDIALYLLNIVRKRAIEHC